MVHGARLAKSMNTGPCMGLTIIMKMRECTKYLLSLLLGTACALGAAAQDTPAKQRLGQQALDDLKQQTTFGGYVIGEASLSNQEGSSKHSDMNIRLVRLYVDGRVLDVAYKLQLQVNGMPGGSSGPRIVDAWAEWQHWKEFRLKFGQMKRGFTFENPMHPWNIGFGAYSQLVTKLAGFSDRVGEHASNGRDFGLQAQGDLFPSRRDGHRWLHYQVGVFNGQGTNVSDANSHKDVIGGLWIAPVPELQIGAFGWAGNFVKDGITVDRNRYGFGLNYTGDKVMVRSEFAVSEGHKTADYFDADGKQLASPTGTDGADAWYVALGAPVAPRTKVWGKWDVYRDAKTWGTARQMYCVSAEHRFHPNVMLQANYVFNDDHLAADRYYHSFDVQLYWRF